MSTSPRIEDVIWDSEPQAAEQVPNLMGIQRRTPQGQEGPDPNNVEWETEPKAGPDPTNVDWDKPEITPGRIAGAAYEGLKDLPRSLWQAGRGVSEALLGEESPTSKYITEVSEAPAIAPKEEYNVSSGWLEDFSRAMPQMASQMLLWGAAAPLGVAAEAGGLLAKVPAAVGGAQGLPGMGYMVAQIAGGQYDTLRKQGVEPKRAAIAAFANGIMQAPLEQIGISKFANLWKPQKDIIQKLKNIAEVTGTEWLTEFLQQYPESATNIFAMNPDKTALEKAGKFIDDIWETTKEGAYQGTLTAPWALLGAGGGVARARVQEAADAQAIKKTQVADALTQAMQAAPGEARKPAIAALTEALTRSGGTVEDVKGAKYIPVARRDKELTAFPSEEVPATETPDMAPTNLETLKGMLYGKQGRAVEAAPAEVVPQQPVTEALQEQLRPIPEAEQRPPRAGEREAMRIWEEETGQRPMTERGLLPDVGEEAPISPTIAQQPPVEAQAPVEARPPEGSKAAHLPEGWTLTKTQSGWVGESPIKKEGKLVWTFDENGELLEQYPVKSKELPLPSKPAVPEAKAPKVGENSKIMGIESTLAKTETVDGIRYDLFNGASLKENRAATRITDLDSGRVVGVKQYPDFNQAETEFKETLETVKKAVTPAKVQTAEKTKGKEPWEMTKAEFIKSPAGKQISGFNKKTQMYPGRKGAASSKRYFTWHMQEEAHKLEIQKALSEGKSIPPEVLKDYPDLAKKAPVKLESLTVTVKAIAPDGTVHELKGQNAKAAIDETVAKRDVLSQILECLSNG